MHTMPCRQIGRSKHGYVRQKATLNLDAGHSVRQAQNRRKVISRQKEPIKKRLQLDTKLSLKKVAYL